MVFELVDIIDETAKESMAVNTIYKKKGKIIGANTDGLGFLESLIKDLAIKLKPGANIFCIGAGGERIWNYISTYKIKAQCC